MSATSYEAVVERIEKIMSEELFTDRLDDYVQNICHIFDEDEEENKLIYTEIFDKYVAMIEEHLEEQLGELEGFDMAGFAATLTARQRDGEVLPLALENLAAMGDFETFKRMVISAKPLAAHFGGVCGVSFGIIDGYVPQEDEEEEEAKAAAAKEATRKWELGNVEDEEYEPPKWVVGSEWEKEERLAQGTTFVQADEVRIFEADAVGLSGGPSGGMVCSAAR